MYPDGTSVMTRSKNAEGVEYEHPETGEFGVIVEFLGPSQGKVMKVDMDIDPKTQMLDYHETFDRMDRNVQQKVLYAVNYLLEQKPANDSGLRRIKKDLELVINKGKMSQNDGQGLLYALVMFWTRTKKIRRYLSFLVVSGSAAHGTTPPARAAEVLSPMSAPTTTLSSTTPL